MGNLVQGNTSKNSGVIGVGCCFQQKACNRLSLKRGKIGPMLLLMTGRKFHTRFRLVAKSTAFDDLERPFRTVFQNT